MENFLALDSMILALPPLPWIPSGSLGPQGAKEPSEIKVFSCVSKNRVTSILLLRDHGSSDMRLSGQDTNNVSGQARSQSVANATTTANPYPTIELKSGLDVVERGEVQPRSGNALYSVGRPALPTLLIYMRLCIPRSRDLIFVTW